MHRPAIRGRNRQPLRKAPEINIHFRDGAAEGHLLPEPLIAICYRRLHLGRDLAQRLGGRSAVVCEPAAAAAAENLCCQRLCVLKGGLFRKTDYTNLNIERSALERVQSSFSPRRPPAPQRPVGKA
jgi:hypothetical protein